jgi:HlyD family secretion protein
MSTIGGFFPSPISWFRRKSPAPPDFVPLQPDLEEILAEPPPRMLRGPLYIVVTLLVIVIILASICRIDIVVTATGRISTEDPPIVLQPMEQAIIREIRVKPGDAVQKGQVLAVLDPTFETADLNVLNGQHSSLTIETARIEAELSGVPFKTEGVSPDEQLQQSLYNQRQAQYGSRIRSFDEDVQRLEAAIHTAEQNRDSLAKQIAIAKEVEGMRDELWQSRNGSKLNFLDAQAGRMRTEREYEDTSNHLVELRHTLAAKQEERKVFIDEWRQKLLEELAKDRMDSNRVNGGLVKANRINELIMLTAPEDAVVLDTARHSVGSILRAAEPLVTLIPSHSALVGEVLIGSGDVGYTKRGDTVAVKVDAFPYLAHGMLKGTLSTISEDSFASAPPPTGTVSSGQSAAGVFHRSRVNFTSLDLYNMPEGAHLIPGMTVTAEIAVGSRSIISYFLSPLQRGLAESIREP